VLEKPMSLAEVRRLGATCDVETAGRALGVSRASAYQSISEGTFPVAVIRVNRRLRVLTADLIRTLEGRDDREPAKSA
jgi:hypothetical protein